MASELVAAEVSPPDQLSISTPAPVEPRTFRAVQSKLVRGLFWAAFAVVFVLLLYQLSAVTALGFTDVSLAADTMYLTGLLTATTVLIAFRILMLKTPETFLRLWQRGIIADKTPEPIFIFLSRIVVPPFVLYIWRQVLLGKKTKPIGAISSPGYARFLEDFAASLNSPAQWITAGVFFFIPLVWRGELVSWLFGHFSWRGFAYTAPEFVVAFLMGLMVWRMIVIAIGIATLGRNFDLTPQLRHPDRCGGFEPLGTLCLWNAVIISLTGIFLGGWAFLLHSKLQLPIEERYAQFAVYYKDMFLHLLIIPVVFSLVGFFVPLWNVHLAMQAKAEKTRSELDQLGQRINALARKLFDDANGSQPGEEAEREDQLKELDFLRKIYQQNQRIPVWPFNAQVLVRLATLQVVPVLSLLGLGTPILDIIRALLGQ